MDREKAKRKKGDNGVPVSYLNGTVVDWKKMRQILVFHDFGESTFESIFECSKKRKKTNLVESDVLGLLTEALSADVHL